MSWYPSCGGEDAPGANYTPPTLGSFNKPALSEQRLREARAESTVVHEARQFHERMARRYGVDTNRGIAHFRASKVFAREGKLQEMLDQMHQQDASGGELGQLNPKAVMKAHSAAAKFHKKQAEKAGLDSDLGHAHVAAMEQHMDVAKKAKVQHQAGGQEKPPKQQKGPAQQFPPKQQQPPPAGAMPTVAAKHEAREDEGGPGSGRHAGGQNTAKMMKHLGFKQDKDGKTWTSKSGRTTIPHHMAVAKARELAGKYKSVNDAFESRRSRINRFGENDDQNCVPSAVPSSVKHQMKPDTVLRVKRMPMKSGTAAVRNGDEHESIRRRSL